MHALAQDGFGFQSFRRVADEVGELGLHRGRLYTSPMGTMLKLGALALFVVCIAGAWIAVRKYSARRRLEDIARKQRGTIKAHEAPAHGQVVEISKIDEHGFIQTDEHRVYFTRASVLDDAFDELAVGTSVAFVEEHGDKGPQASTVRVLGKHHYAAP